ncbi:hypothetical protein [Bacillus paranthracis]|uniref:hypothetical protein n=1 Tax=Bacillus paranthracis TaxID=2026186 RepID=UPI000200F5E9|nr:hypothetical protein [Bacillus paranthracis]ADY20417.1 hypothetical protein YBT020_05855 [Bacillus thuringiensis serovar finitimus YBT-020]OTX71357.1 hypothetical protein BK722_13180 [Bacillus thuringiensis serovar finitimus]
MNTVKKRKFLILFFTAIIVVTISYIASSIHDRNITKEKAAEVAIQHIKTRENIDVIVTKVDMKPAFQGGFIEVRGYAKNDKKENFMSQ